MAASSAPAIKAELLTLLQASSGLEDVQIEYSHPGSTIQAESIYFGKTIETEVPGALGNRRQNEDYTIEVIVDCTQGGDDAQTCEERCWAMVAVLENVIRDNNGPTGALSALLGGGYVLYAGTDMTPYIETAGRLSEAVCQVRVVNRK